MYLDLDDIDEEMHTNARKIRSDGYMMYVRFEPSGGWVKLTHRPTGISGTYDWCWGPYERKFYDRALEALHENMQQAEKLVTEQG